MVIYVLWTIAGTLVETFICTPIDTLWLHPLEIPDKCIYYSTFWVVIMGVEVVLDFIILVAPIAEITKLQLSAPKKWMLAFIFLLGGL